MGGGTKVAVDEDTQVTDSVDWFNGRISDRDWTAKEAATVDAPTHTTSPQVLLALSWSRFEHIQLEILSTQTEVSVDRVEIATGGQEP